MAAGPVQVITCERPGEDVLAVAGQVLEAGAPVLQIRIKGKTDSEVWRQADALSRLCAEHGAACIVNDRLDIALAVAAQAVHLGESDLPVGRAHSVAAGRIAIGATARDPEAARHHQRSGAAYLGVGPVYPTASKRGLPAAIGPAGLAAVCAAVSIPVIAIGGITPAHIPEVAATGAAGVAVLGAVFRAPDPGAATRAILDAWAAADARG